MAMKRYLVAGRVKVPRGNGHMFTPIENFRYGRFGGMQHRIQPTAAAALSDPLT